jgi:hypothetical protein
VEDLDDLFGEPASGLRRGGVVDRAESLVDLPGEVDSRRSGLVVAMWTEASRWLAKRGSNQWAVAWPNPEAQCERILTSIRALRLRWLDRSTD